MTAHVAARTAVETPTRCTPADAAAFISDALARTAGAMTFVTVPAPVAAPERLLEIDTADHAVLWCPPDGVAFAGAGEAVRLELDGLRIRAAELWRSIAELSFPGCAPPPPRLFGGLAFARGSASEPPWSAFGDGSFSLPRWRYAVDGERAWLTLTGHRESRSAADEAVDILRALAEPALPTPPSQALRHIERPPLEPWTEQIDAIRAEIASGRCEKIVAAHRCVVDMSGPIVETSVLARLAERYPDCFRYAIRHGDAAFVGATPERLIDKRGATITTDALAGSIDVGAGPHPDDTLRASGKDLSEHEFVVRAILDGLAPFCDQLDVPARPEICTLRNLLHLRTPIAGRLRVPTHVLDLVDALHPTPAVGGVPTTLAMEWIAEHESAPRGWYAGPIGWFDAAGDGEFAVALRSGLLVDDRAYVYAGAGIVAESDAAAEFAETSLKQRALLGALGADK